MKAIPQSVLDVLKHKWKPFDGYSSFDSVFSDEQDKERRTVPSYYNIAAGKKVEYDIDVLSNAEAENLVKDKVFGSLAVSRETGVVINEHAQHALTDFCSEVYAAWERYNKRIREVEKIGVFPRPG